MGRATNIQQGSEIRWETFKYRRRQPILPKWRASIFQKMAVNVLPILPAKVQRKVSKAYGKLFELRITRHLIKPYCNYHYEDKNYLKQFKPPYGKERFESFQDFFIREFNESTTHTAKSVWNSEGNLCHAGYVADVPYSNVKGQIRTVDDIFGVPQNTIPKDHFFTNIFLHNKNYHRIHAPVKGKIIRIQHKQGDLVVLRPWIYKSNPSIPAFRNERINIDIEDENGGIWYLSIVGGPAVGTIELNEGITLGAMVKPAQQLALFLLGSTCCMAAPEKMSDQWHEGAWVEMGQAY